MTSKKHHKESKAEKHTESAEEHEVNEKESCTKNSAEESSSNESEERTEEAAPEVPLEEQEIAPNDWDDIEDIAELKKMLGTRTSESSDYLDKLKRLKAEYTNYQNRMVRERERISQFAIQSFAEDVFHVLDTFSMALENAEKLDIPDSMNDFVKGISITKDQLFETLTKRGVEEIEAEGKDFDPHFMEALTTMPGEEDNKVMQVFRAGYKIGERALRPAQVIVSKAVAPAAESTTQKEDTKETVEN
jgi:molecular chaperone GrpE